MPRRPIRLSQLSHGAGCACKIRIGDLKKVVGGLPRVTDRRVLVGHDTGDDAAVYRIDANTAVVETIDFFTPMVDDPYTFGQIAAANAISDVYAMGGRPIFALNVVAYPAQDLPLETLGEILRGGSDKAAEAGIPVLGGHSIDDPEPKYGMAVTGLVHPRRVLTNAGARPGDILVLTKPLGSGIISTAIKRGKAPPRSAEAAIATMSSLNRNAGEVIAAAFRDVHGLTDVTGYSLLGHLLGMCRASRVGARLIASAVPQMPGALQLARDGVIPGGTRANRTFVEPDVDFDRAIPDEMRFLLGDAQTNGGLLASVSPRRSAALLRALKRRGVHGHAIGQVVAGKPRIRVEP